MASRPRHNDTTLEAIRNMVDTTTQLVAKMRKRNARNEPSALAEFQRNHPPVFKRGYDPDGAKLWLQKLEKIFTIMECPNMQKVTLSVFMLEGEVENWWHGTQQLMMVAGEVVTWEAFQRKFLEKYFPENVRRAKETEFMYLRQGNMTVGEYAAKFEALSEYATYYQHHPDAQWKCQKFEV
ncbi:uncharacterized protein LOC113871551 [Abrus precatorius]|uniref:Uncharacterized protein LOC113871551 n=1 Tax=Abrus precatorius TaxID=3816 RepID=A0A8B8MBH1_ABRPR|nr:uncharacterized protein LOC113871551 [Abrus precatorius]